jgi:PadR family transcriptional regulator, regulatory protein PadR
MSDRGAPPLLRGTLDIMVLKALTTGANHGYGITAWLEKRSGGVLDVDDSAMYQALHRLEERDLVSAGWALTESGRRARYYTLTSAGRAWLRSHSAEWFRYSAAVSTILRAPSR